MCNSNSNCPNCNRFCPSCGKPLNPTTPNSGPWAIPNGGNFPTIPFPSDPGICPVPGTPYPFNGIPNTYCGSGPGNSGNFVGGNTSSSGTSALPEVPSVGESRL